MHKRVFQDGSVSLTDDAINAVSRASRRLASGDSRMSQHEFNAAAIVNGRLDLLDRDYRIDLVAMGRDCAHAVIEQIYANWENEMTLSAEHAEAPVGDQRMFPASTV